MFSQINIRIVSSMKTCFTFRYVSEYQRVRFRILRFSCYIPCRWLFSRIMFVVITLLKVAYVIANTSNLIFLNLMQTQMFLLMSSLSNASLSFKSVIMFTIRSIGAAEDMWKFLTVTRDPQAELRVT